MIILTALKRISTYNGLDRLYDGATLRILNFPKRNNASVLKLTKSQTKKLTEKQLGQICVVFERLTIIGRNEIIIQNFLQYGIRPIVKLTKRQHEKLINAVDTGKPFEDVLYPFLESDENLDVIKRS